MVLVEARQLKQRPSYTQELGEFSETPLKSLMQKISFVKKMNS